MSAAARSANTGDEGLWARSCSYSSIFGAAIGSDASRLPRRRASGFHPGDWADARGSKVRKKKNPPLRPPPPRGGRFFLPLFPPPAHPHTPGGCPGPPPLGGLERCAPWARPMLGENKQH